MKNLKKSYFIKTVVVSYIVNNKHHQKVQLQVKDDVSGIISDDARDRIFKHILKKEVIFKLHNIGMFRIDSKAISIVFESAVVEDCKETIHSLTLLGAI